MYPKTLLHLILALALASAGAIPVSAQIGRRFPSEKKIITDPVTGIPLTFLTRTPAGDSKIYPTHPQWTADGQWLIFRSNRVPNQAMAVNEETGDLVQVTETGYRGALCIAQKSIRLFFTRPENHLSPEAWPISATTRTASRPRLRRQVILRPREKQPHRLLRDAERTAITGFG
ncbi:MAG TPA: hypothetical protein VHF69_00310, partial [Candidatus Synoicihabitans sp.]|nr:hypothetical protein [Candidatus Synoicihabitans sp.]